MVALSDESRGPLLTPKRISELRAFATGACDHRVNYLIISPVKNEARYVERTLNSVVNQTTQPIRWIIVNDGSTDNTRAIVRQYAEKYPFIQLLDRPAGQRRQPGRGVIEAFNVGLNEAAGTDYDYIVKLDCDLSFAPSYFDTLISRFTLQPKLGIASGVYQEPTAAGEWRTVKMPSYHAAGASKVVRRECFEQIGGFVASRGWDTVDEIKAMYRGWTTTHFGDLQMCHWKPEGSGIGPMRTSTMHGEIYYLTGGGILFFLFKVAARMPSSPLVAASGALLWGYLRFALKRIPKLVSTEESRFYRSLLNRRLAVRFGLRS